MVRKMLGGPAGQRVGQNNWASQKLQDPFGIRIYNLTWDSMMT
jgi:hypothetical protein